MITSLGNDVETNWKNLLAGKSGADYITHFDASKFKTRFACEVKDYDFTSLLDKKEIRRHDRFSLLAIAASDEAMRDAQITINEQDAHRFGVIYGSGMGGLHTLDSGIADYVSGDGTPKFNPFFIPMVITSIAPGILSIRYGCKGLNFATTSACASSSHAIASAYHYIRLGLADAIITGGSESSIEFTGVGGFNSLHALSTRNDSPQTASRPFSASRDGFVLGEGAATLILEEYEHAKQRGAKIYAEIVGTGMTSDAHHITASDPEGQGAARAMQLAIQEAQIDTKQIDYINTHGTSTAIGDIAEVKAIKNVFGKHAYQINLTSSKSMTGHLLGATGAVEAVISILSIIHQKVTPTINHDENDIDPNIDYQLNFTFNQAQERSIRYALSNNYGFGGQNASLLFKKWEE